MRDVSEQDCAHLVCRLAEHLPVKLSGVRRRAGDDHLWLVLARKCQNLIRVDRAVRLTDAIAHNLVVHAREVYWAAVREMPSLIEPETHERVSGLEERLKHSLVRLHARVRLHVGKLRSEQLAAARACKVLDLINNVASAVVALPRLALRVLIGEH